MMVRMDQEDSVQITVDMFTLVKKTKKHVCNFKNMENRSPYGTWVCPHCSDHPIFNTR